MPKYSLIGVDGNAFSIVSYVTRAMRTEKFTQEQIQAYKSKAVAGSYENLVAASFNQIEKVNEAIKERRNKCQ